MSVDIAKMKRFLAVALMFMGGVSLDANANANANGHFPLTVFAAAFTLKVAVATIDSDIIEEEEGIQILEATKKTNKTASELDDESSSLPPDSESESKSSCRPSSYDPSILEDPCQLDASLPKSPDRFSLVFPTQYGRFTAECSRKRAPVWADRVYKLALHGYYNANYFFRVLPGKYAQFGTNGHPSTSNAYNYTSAPNPECSILDPQPPFMPYCMASSSSPNHHGDNDSDYDFDCDGDGLSNDFGTIAMSTSYNQDFDKHEFPRGVTWNATAELFINIGSNNQFLDSNLFVPICTIARHEMEDVVLKFPSFGEVAELGGDGPSLGNLYQDGNAYIESNPDWKASMAVTGIVEVCGE